MSAPHPGTREYRNTAVRLADLTVNTDMLEDLQFFNCTVIGPAVLFILDNNQFNNCNFTAPDIEALFWLVAPERQMVVGAIGARRVEFYSCSFQRIGLAGPPELRQAIEQGIVFTD
jgi:hypothetical protein